MVTNASGGGVDLIDARNAYESLHISITSMAMMLELPSQGLLELWTSPARILARLYILRLATHRTIMVGLSSSQIPSRA